MSRLKDFDLFRKDNDLGLDAERSAFAVEAYRRERRGLPWGTESGGECPECGKDCVNINGARWYCFYCGSGGELEGIELTPEQQAAERELRKEDQARNREKALRIWNEASRSPPSTPWSRPTSGRAASRSNGSPTSTA